jgi:hypothetical protein
VPGTENWVASASHGLIMRPGADDPRLFAMSRRTAEGLGYRGIAWAARISSASCR